MRGGIPHFSALKPSKCAAIPDLCDWHNASDWSTTGARLAVGRTFARRPACLMIARLWRRNSPQQHHRVQSNDETASARNVKFVGFPFTPPPEGGGYNDRSKMSHL